MRTPAFTFTETLRRRLTGAVLPLLATALLLALPSVAAAQPRVLVISLSESPLTVNEVTQGTTAETTEYGVRLSTEPSSDVIVTVASGDTDAATVSPSVLTFMAGDWYMNQTVTVTGDDEDRVDNPGDERVVTITNTPSGGGFRTAKDVEVTVYDNDEAGLVLVFEDTDGVEVDEGGTNRTETYTVALDSKPTGDVIVAATSGDTSAATVSPAALTFTPVNWETPQTVTVAGVDDKVDNPDGDDAGDVGERSVTITHTPDGGGYGAEEAKTVPVKVEDQGTGTTPGDDRGLDFSSPSPVVIEGQQATYTVKLMSKPTGTVTVELNRDTTVHIRLRPQFLTFTTANWDASQTVTVTGFNDEVDDEDNNADALSRTTTITHRATGGGYDGIEDPDPGVTGPPVVVVGLRDDDTAGLALSTKALTLIDQGNTATYTVALRSKPASDVTVEVTVVSGDDANAVQGVDTDPDTAENQNELTFTVTEWSTAQTVTVIAEEDDIYNSGSNRVVNILNDVTSSGNMYDDLSANVEVTVDDNDTADVILSESRLTLVENGASAAYTVALTSEPDTTPVVVTLSGTGLEFSPASLSFPSGTSAREDDDGDGIKNWAEAQTIEVSAPDDNFDRGTRRVTVAHEISGGGYGNVAEKSVTVTINDEPDEPTAHIRVSSSSVGLSESAPSGQKYTVTLRQDPQELEPPQSSVTVALAVVDAAGGASTDIAQVSTEVEAAASTVSLTFDSTNLWNVGQTITVTPVDDEVDNGGSRSVDIRHTAGDLIGIIVPVTVRDDDVAGLLIDAKTSEQVAEGGTVKYEVKLNSSPVVSVNVRVVSTDPAIATVTGAEEAGTGTTVNVTEGLGFTPTNWEGGFTVTVTAASDNVDNPGSSRGVDITFTPSGDGDYGSAPAKTERVTVRDDDTAALDIAPTELSIPENSGTQSYVVKLATKPTGTVNVAVSSSDLNAATVDKSVLRFTPDDDDDQHEMTRWNRTQTVLVTGVLDSTRGDRTATITNIPSGGGYGSGQSGRVTVTVEEDTTPGLRITPRELTVVEGATATYTVELNAAPQGDVTVAISSGSPAASVSHTSLTFTTTNWDSPQQVTVTGADDEVVTGDRKATINHSSDGGAHNYSYTATADVTVMEDDATLALSSQAVTVSETGTGAYTVKLDGRPNGTVTVELESVGPDVATVSPAELTFTPANYATAQTVTVSGVNDRVDNSGGSRSTSITHTPSGGGYDSTEPTSVSVTVTDDEGLQVSQAAVTAGEAGGTASYTLALRAEPTANVTVALASSNTDVATVSPAVLVFTPANWSTPQSVTVTGVDDDVDNPGDARSATISHTPSGSGHSTVETVAVTVTDDDAAPSGIALSADVQSVSEDAAATTVTVTAAPVGTRFGTARTLTVQVGASGDSATAGTDYAAVVAFTITIPAGAADASASFTLTPLDDAVFEGEETITVTAQSPGGVPVFGTTVALTDNDAAPILSIEGSDVAEGADGTTSVLVFTVRKSGATSEVATTVQYADNLGGSADSGMDYAPLPAGTLTFAADETEKSITVTVWGDDTYEVDETIQVELSNPTNGELAVAMAAGTIGNDDPAPEFSISAESDGRIAEGQAGTSSVLRFTVTKSGATSEVATVGYADALSGTATPESDYAAIPPGTLTFAAGESEQKIRVVVRGDAIYELDESIDVTLNNATHATIAVGIASGTIVDDDTQPVLSISESSVTEGAAGTMSELVFTVTKSGAETEVPTTVEYVDAGTGTADSGTDYAAVMPAMLSFAPGESSQTITVTVYGDDIYEEDETVDIRLSNPEHATLVTVVASGTILNDDAQPVLSISGMSIAEGAAGTMSELVFTVTKTGSVSQVATTVDYADAGTGTARSDDDYAAIQPGTLTFAAAEAEKTISVMVQGDAVYEEDETVDIVLRNPTHGTIETEMASGIIENDDAAPELSIVGSSVAEGADGTTAELVFTVVKSGSVSQVATTVDFSDAGSGTATSGTDYMPVVAGTLTFAADEFTQMLTVTVLGDTVYEDDETVDIMLSNAAHGTIATGTASGTILNDEAAPALAVSGSSVVEGDEGSTIKLVFTVTKIGLPSEVPTTVDYADAGTGTAVSGVDYLEIVPGTLTFAPAETEMTFTVVVQGDAVFEENETVDVVLSNVIHGVIAAGTASGIIVNDDVAPTLAISGSTVTEGDADTTTSLLFTVTKSGPTERVATVSYRDTGKGTAESGTDYRKVGAGTLTFAAGETTQTIRVVVIGDNVYEEDETVEIELRNPSNATIAAGKGKAMGTITDDDPLPQVAKDWLARFGRGAANATLDAIARRMNDAAAVGESSMTMAGRQMSLAPAPAAVHLAPVVEPWEEGVATVLTLEELANGSGFDLERSFAEGYLNVWGAAGYSQFEMTPRGTYMMDGSLMSAILGVDHEGANHVLGIALAYHGGSGTFSGLGSGSAEGDIGSNLFSLHPYVRVSVNDMYHIGGSLGFGTGDLRIEQTGGEVVELGVGMPIMAAADVRVDLSLMETWILAIQADGSIVQMATAETDDMPAVEAGSSRLRLGLENSFAFLLDEGVSLAPVLEVGVRYDDGDAETGLGLDLGGAVRFDVTAVGLMVEARGQASLANLPEEEADDADEAPALRNWSVGGVIRWRPLGPDMGPQVSVAPSWSGTGISGAAGLNAEIGYGVAVFGNGVLTPYGAARFSDSVPAVYHVGARLELDRGFQLSAEGTHEEVAGGIAGQFFTVQLRLLQ